MKINLIPAFFSLIILYSCGTSPTKNAVEDADAVNDSIQIVTKLYKNSDELIEYEIPILKGTKIKHGEQKRFYRHGSLYSTIPYVNGKREGTAFTYYPAAEKVKPVVWKEQVYKNNLLDGICKRYHDNGILQAEYEYKNGLPAVGLKEYTKSGKPVEHATLVLTKKRVHDGYYITAKLSKEKINVDYYIGNLVEGKYFPGNLKSLQEKSGLGEIIVPLTNTSVCITAVYSTRYQNQVLISKTISLP
jgi:hypothetical protein